MWFRTSRAVRRLCVPVAQRHWPLVRLWYRAHGLQLDGGPDDHIWYFAYGANMHDAAFRDRRGMRPAEWRVGRPKGKSAPANICADADGEVWGVPYRITRRDLVQLNASEGVPGGHYRPVDLPAEDAAGNRLRAMAYMANGNEQDGNPSLRYLTLIRDGARAHGLPAYWLACLDNVRHWE